MSALDLPAPRLELCRLALDGGVATLTMADPEGANALSWTMFDDLVAATGWVSDRDDVRAFVLAAEGDSWCSGGDVHSWYAERKVADDPWRTGRRQAARACRLVNAIVATIRAMPWPTVAVMDGFTVGAGVGLALACDLRFASDRARLLLGYSRLGASPDAGVTWMLPRIVGEARALELLLEDRPLRAARLAELGLVSAVVPRDELADVVRARVQRLVRRNPPQYTRSVKQLMLQQRTGSYVEQLHAEREGLIAAVATQDADAGMEAFAQGRSLPPFNGWAAPTSNGARAEEEVLADDH